MSNTFTLDEITEAANATYSNVEIPLGNGESVVLVNALQLSAKDRKALVEIQEQIDEQDDTTALENALRIAGSTTPEATEVLITLLDGNLAKLITVFSKYSKGTQVGEA